MPTPPRFAPELTPTVGELHRRANVPEEWHVSVDAFQVVLERSAGSRFAAAQPSAREIIRYIETLNLRDLALACACSAGNPAAWDEFIAQYRPELYRAARAIAGESSGRDLADSLYAELYGLEMKEGRRRSLFDYFHGRSKLGTWLRAILAQRHVNEIRRGRRTESLDEPEREEPAGMPQDAVRLRNDAEPDRARYLSFLQIALTDALAALEPRDRLRLAYYYVDDLTLAQIGRLLGEHEATVSRKLDRVRRDLRLQVDAALREKKRLSEAQLRLCYEYAKDEWPFDLTRALTRKE